MVNWLMEQTISTRLLKLTSVKSCNDISYDSSPSPGSTSPTPASSPEAQPLSAAVVQQIMYNFKMDYTQVSCGVHVVGGGWMQLFRRPS